MKMRGHGLRQCRRYIYGHVYRVIVGLSKSFLKRRNTETSLEQV